MGKVFIVAAGAADRLVSGPLEILASADDRSQKALRDAMRSLPHGAYDVLALVARGAMVREPARAMESVIQMGKPVNPRPGRKPKDAPAA